MNISTGERNPGPMLVALLAISLGACNLPAQVEPTVESGDAGIAGRLWHDVCAVPGSDQAMPEIAPDGCVPASGSSGYIANGRLDQNEAGIGGVEVILGQGTCPSFGLATTRTEDDGLYLFAGLGSGVYCVSIDSSSSNNAATLHPGTWTYPGAGALESIVSTQVDLEPAEIQADVYFAWDFQLLPPYETPTALAPATDTPEPETPTPTLTASPEFTSTATASSTPELSPTPTLGAEDPRSSLNMPTWVDSFEDQSDWALYSDAHARFEIVEDGLHMTAFKPDFFNSWVLSWRKVKDLYLEASGSFGACGGRDSYGLMIRSTGGNNGYTGYLFGISCDGRYSLRSWDGESMATIVGWTTDESIQAGPEKSNRVGIWADGDKLSLYVNGEFLMQVNDTLHEDEGLFGLFVSSGQTTDFTTLVKEIAFWNLD